MKRRTLQSAYMNWAKTRSGATYNLAASDLSYLPISELPVTWEKLELATSTGYGYPPLLDSIGRHEGVDPKCVVSTIGTSMANYVAMASLIQPGDEVVIEHPTYELLVSTAEFLGADVKRFHRRFEDDFLIEPGGVRKAVTPNTRLIVITNLHNPSNAFTDEGTLNEIAAIARGVGARVLVDEVYLDAAFSRAPRSAFHLGPEFVTTDSLTKVYGISGLRCGWILAEPDVAQQMRRLVDLHYSTHVTIAEQLSVIAFAHLGKIAQRDRKSVV